MRKMKTLAVLIAWISGVAVSNLSCSNSGVEVANVFDQAQFERNRELWTEKNVRNYRMVIGAWGFKPNYSEQVLIEVRNGTSASIDVLWDSGGGPAGATRPFDSVEKVFEFVFDQSRRSPQRFEVKYDREFGYPTSVEIDQDGEQGNQAPIRFRIKRMEIIES